MFDAIICISHISAVCGLFSPKGQAEQLLSIGTPSVECRAIGCGLLSKCTGMWVRGGPGKEIGIWYYLTYMAINEEQKFMQQKNVQSDGSPTVPTIHFTMRTVTLSKQFHEDNNW